jgi:hypothetical protein
MFPQRTFDNTVVPFLALTGNPCCQLFIVKMSTWIQDLVAENVYDQFVGVSKSGSIAENNDCRVQFANQCESRETAPAFSPAWDKTSL